MAGLRVTVTGATGLIGRRLIDALRDRGATVTALTRDPERAEGVLDEVECLSWRSTEEPVPASALAGRDAVVHLAGERVDQRWSARARRVIRDSRVLGTRNLLAGLRDAQPRPSTLISSSAVGYYGSHGEEPLDEDAAAGRGFLAQLCREWEAEAANASELGLRVVQLRTGMVLDRRGGALARMLPLFRMGLGGPVAGGAQYMSWIHLDDLIMLALSAVEDPRWSGAINATAPEPVPNREFARALGEVLQRPAHLPVPGFALRLLYGEMAQVLTSGARVVPAKALVLGYRFAHPELREALRSALR